MLIMVNKLLIKSLGVYIHVPFCKSKCPYCDFYSLNYDDDLVNLYLESLVKKIEYWSNKLKKYKVDTIYFGGGTPNLLKAKQIGKVIKSVQNNFVMDNPEITIEMNPSKTSKTCDDLHIINEYLYLSDLGVNRVSIGMQSANENELVALGRKHLLEDTERTIKLFKKANIKNISLDLMLAIPNQTEKSVLQSIDFCKKQQVTHVSAYLLKIEKGTPYYKNKSKLNLLDDDKTGDLYLFAAEELEKKGFIQYEISNFCTLNKESRHNLKYWSCDDYLGLGPSAHSFLNGKRFYYANSLKDFINKENVIVNDGFGGTEEEYLMLRLRLFKGVNSIEFKNKFNKDIPLIYYKKAKPYERLGLVICNENGIRFTKKGFLVSNQLICKIVL